MNEKIIALAAIKVFYETNNDFVAVFGNLIILVVNDSTVSLTDIKTILSTKIDLNLPNDVLQTIVRRLRKNNLLSVGNINDFNSKSIKLVEKGHAAEVKIRNSYENAKREKNALISSLKIYAEKNNLNYSLDELAKELDFFIEKNPLSAINALQRELCDHSLSTTKIQKCISDFFIESEKSDQENFERLKAVLYGKIISAAFLDRKFCEDAKIKKLDIYLDTNIIFSLMGLDEEWQNIPVKEVVELIKKAGGTLKVFSFTKDEILNKLRGYLNGFDYYSDKIKVSSIYYALKRKGYSKLNVITLIENIEVKLKEMEITIDYSFNPEDLLKGKEDEVSKLNSYKASSSIGTIKHDLAAILAVKCLREMKLHYLWEKSKSIFLSADYNLVAYDFREHGHKKLGTFPEAVFRSDLASMLWLKGGTGTDNVFMHNFFANHMRDKVISTSLWNKFIEEIKRKHDEGKITEDDIEDIMSFSETEKILREKGVEGIREILDDEKINQRRQNLQKKDNDNVKNKEIILNQAETLKNISDGVTRECQDLWKNKIDFAVYLVSAVIFLIVIWSMWYFGLSLVASIIQIFTLAVVIVFVVSVVQKKEFRFLWFFINLRNSFENKKIADCIVLKKKKYKINNEDQIR